LGITTIHVTHDLIESEEMADRMAVLNMGHVEQIGTPAEVFFYPHNETVADLVGTPNILTCDQVKPIGHGLVEAVCGGMSIILPLQDGGIKKIALFPRDIYISTTKPPGPELNRFKGVVMDIQPFSSLIRLKVRVGKNKLLAELPQDIFEEMDIKTNQEVFMILKLRRLRIH
jgi:ABC-type Fe3+/spermidine/putrescine transport system ATPase subunit